MVALLPRTTKKSLTCVWVRCRWTGQGLRHFEIGLRVGLWWTSGRTLCCHCRLRHRQVSASLGRLDVRGGRGGWAGNPEQLAAACPHLLHASSAACSIQGHAPPAAHQLHAPSAAHLLHAPRAACPITAVVVLFAPACPITAAIVLFAPACPITAAVVLFAPACPITPVFVLFAPACPSLLLLYCLHPHGELL
jgi:hypothetical protein